MTFFETQTTGEYKLIHFKKWFLTFLSAFAKFRKSSSCLSVCLHVTTRLSPERPFFRKSVYQIQVSFQTVKDNRNLTWKPLYIYENISLKSSQNEKYFRQGYRENQDTHFTFDNFFPFRNHVVYELMWENIVKPDRPRMTI